MKTSYDADSRLCDLGASMRIAVGFATCGRPDTLAAALECVDAQSRPPDAIIVCYTRAEDITGVPARENVIFRCARAGLPIQRNAVLSAVPDFDLVVFFDDDFLASPRYLEAVEHIFSAHPDIVAAAGLPIADGVKGPGITVTEAMCLIAGDGDLPASGIEPASHAYGCNMVIRLAIVREHSLEFDERLPLYAWSEDMDFTHRIARFGRIVKIRDARGVHLGTKRGRGSGRRLGYSQVANPIYLRAKGSYTWRRALGSVGRNVVANSFRSLWPEPYIDRRGRLLGNLRAFADLTVGKLSPERILEF